MKTLNRINLIWTLLWLTMLLTGCSTAWTSEAVNIITLLGPAITSILGILSAFGLGLPPTVMSAVSAWSATAVTGLQQVKALIDQYNTATAAAKPGFLTEIQTALKVIDDNLLALLPTIKVTDPGTQAKILAVVGAFQSELAALIALVPALQGKTGHEETKRLIADLKTAKEFKKDFNAQVAPFGKQYEI